jgi:hypothetical protein
MGEGCSGGTGDDPSGVPGACSVGAAVVGVAGWSARVCVAVGPGATGEGAQADIKITSSALVIRFRYGMVYSPFLKFQEK